MSIPSGTHRLGPDDATLSVHTTRTGAAAKAGHNLLIDVDRWEATLTVADDPAQSALALTADGGSLRVVDGTGGMQALGDDDKASIKSTIDDEILGRAQIVFRSTKVTADGDTVHFDGDLTLAGMAHPISFDLSSADGRLSARAVITQTRWGLKPYSTLFGTLRVGDDVEVTLDGRLPASGGGPP